MGRGRDLFAVGVVLWEMLCGASLFGRDSLQATLKAVLFDPIPSPRSRRVDIPRDVERVTMKLLERRPEDRYRDAGAAIAAIAACGAFPRDAFPDDGPELLSRVLVERLPDRALRRRAGHATRSERPGLARSSAGADPEGTAPELPAPPPPEHRDPFSTTALREPRTRRVLPLALLGAATVLTAGLAVGAAAHRGGGADPDLPPPSAAAPTASTVNAPPSSGARASVLPEVPAASTPTPPIPAPRSPARIAAPPAGASHARARRAPTIDHIAPSNPTVRPVPDLYPENRDGIRVIDLHGSSWK